MQYTIQIPKPCHESWEEMTAAEQGRHCAQCCKTVIDFTNWQQEDILNYLQQAAGKVCGRFRNEQVNVPVTAEQFTTSVTYSLLPFYKKIAAILLFAFGMVQMSCDSPPQVNQQANPNAAITTSADTVQKHPMIMGKPIPPPARPALQKHKHAKKTTPPEPFIKGDVMIEEVHPPQPLMGTPFVYTIEDTTATDTTSKKR